ncbi:MAG: hypothetical protein FWH26_02150 [Oscillospiraceae bacterium]|nr:hypothetical protein [Oscillospiraceae bacterium]
MIDLHCHILHDIDDGPSTAGEALRMAALAAADGVSDIVATPHFYRLSRPETFYHARDARLRELRLLLEREGIDLRLHPGAEVFVDDDIFYAGDLEPACINGSRYLLAEFGFGQLRAARFRQYLEEIFSRGLVPVIAHPERCLFLQRGRDLIDEAAESGALFQVSATSLAGWGYVEQEIALQLVTGNIATVLATDAHDAARRGTALATMCRGFPPEITEEAIHYMTRTAPAALLKNEVPPARD